MTPAAATACFTEGETIVECVRALGFTIFGCVAVYAFFKFKYGDR